MVRLDTGSDKVQKICEVLKNETLEPAQRQAEKIIDDAHASAEKIIEKARAEIKKAKQKHVDDVAQRMQVLESSLKIAAKKSLSFLRQEITDKLFNAELAKWVGEKSTSDDVVAGLIEAIVAAVSRDGLEADLQAIIPKLASKEVVSAALVKRSIDNLKDLTIGEFFGGAQVKLVDRNLIVDLSDEALKGLLASYISNDLRKYVFEAE